MRCIKRTVRVYRTGKRPGAAQKDMRQGAARFVHAQKAEPAAQLAVQLLVVACDYGFHPRQS